MKFLHRLVFKLISRKVSRAGEPWKSFFDPNSLMMDLKAAGFSNLKNIDPETINALFFRGRTDKLAVGNFGHLMKAVV